MQLQMTAPLDIGLEQTDAQLNMGQDDVFDLEHTQRGIQNQADFATDADGDIDLDDEDEDEGAADDGEDDEALDSDEERERKVSALEADIDNLYDAYQERLRDRDLKYKAKEARRKNAAKEEWHGVAEKDSDDDDSDAESEGGWDLVQNRKLDDGGGSSDESSDEEDEEDGAGTSKARQNKRRKKAETPAAPQSKRRKLSDDATPIAPSASSSAWFKQDLFKGIGDIDVLDDDMESVEGEDDSDVEGSSAEDDDAMSVDGGVCFIHPSAVNYF
jgi:AdoMet-dependent rRNA methyltransferase SPB1